MAEKKKKYRLAQTKLPGGQTIERPWNSSELFVLYRRGWIDGAARAGMRQNHENVPEYARGYKNGYDARKTALDRAAKRMKHKPSILRLAEKDDDHERP